MGEGDDCCPPVPRPLLPSQSQDSPSSYPAPPAPFHSPADPLQFSPIQICQPPPTISTGDAFNIGQKQTNSQKQQNSTDYDKIQNFSSENHFWKNVKKIENSQQISDAGMENCEAASNNWLKNATSSAITKQQQQKKHEQQLQHEQQQRQHRGSDGCDVINCCDSVGDNDGWAVQCNTSLDYCYYIYIGWA